MMSIIRFLITCLCALVPFSAGAAVTGFPAISGTEENALKIASVTDLPVFRPMIEAFQKRYPDIAISYEESTSAKLDAVSQNACLGETFFADLVISSSLPRQIWFVNEGCADPLAGINHDSLPIWANWRNEIIGLTYEPVVMVYNKQAFKDRNVPKNRFDLIELLRQSDTFEGRIGTYDIESSGVGYFLAFQDSEQASTWGRLLEGLGRNKVKLFCCTGEILDRVADGRLLLGYNVLGAYAFDRARKDPRLGIIMPSDYTLVMTRTAFVPKTAKRKAAAKLFLNFFLSPEGQTILENRMNFTSPTQGAGGLQENLPGGIDSLRPIALSPTLLVPIDREKRRMFVEQWRNSIRQENTP